jgi:anthranilate phosphoribosyltransferase
MSAPVALHELLLHHTMPRTEARAALLDVADGVYNDAQVAAFCAVYHMRAMAQEELAGFREALLERSLPLPKELAHGMDMCGTGGDGKDSFNISTLAAFVVAGAGGRVVKHGNHGASSACGSSTVLETLGCRFTADVDVLQRALNESGICFLHAPLFHPSLRKVAPVRKQLGVRTFFNVLGPLVNPARPTHQLVGVSDLELGRSYRYQLQEAAVHFTVLHGTDGYDEASLTAPVHVATPQGEDLLEPSDLGLPTCWPEDLASGGSPEEAARIFMRVLEGRGSPAQHHVVIANAAFALRTWQGGELVDRVAQASEALYSGRALEAFKNFLTHYKD